MKLVILDRDGVINEDSVNFIKTPNEWIPIQDSLESIALLNQSGFKVAIATNQSGISRGLFDVSTLNLIHEKMFKLLSQQGGHIDAIFFCPHRAEENCECRKPKPGLMHEIAKRYLKNRATQDLPLNNIPIVGDSLRDLLAGTALGATPHLVLTGKGSTMIHADLPEGTQIHPDLMAFAKHIVSQS